MHWRNELHNRALETENGKSKKDTGRFLLRKRYAEHHMLGLDFPIVIVAK
ncbi:MAG: hypothetical protein M3115_00705 [Thermoproteota archaeon]|nr:hypothetical protein [Thermoproteota archaeon]